MPIHNRQERSIEDAHVHPGSSFAAGHRRQLCAAEPMTLRRSVLISIVSIIVVPTAAMAAVFAALWLLIFLNGVAIQGATS